MFPHPEVLSDKSQHNTNNSFVKKTGPEPSRSGLRPTPVCPLAPRGRRSYWLLQPCEPEELPACFFLRLLRSRLLEVFRSLIFTWS